MLSPVVIRETSPDDAPAIVAIRRAVASESDYTLVEPDEMSTDEVAERRSIEGYAASPGWLHLVAEVDGKVVGYIEFRNGGLRRIAHSGSFSIYLDSEHREIGIGSMLMERLIEWARASPIIEKVTLAVFSTNERAQRLYRKFGFQEEGRCPRDMKLASGEYIDSVLMYLFV
jgi:ribosomal protein S18 acetylase RimI-like enzyme